MDADVKILSIAEALEGFGGGDITAICEKIKLSAYMRSLKSGSTQNITISDCNKIISESHNMITKDDLLKFESFKNNGKI